MEVLSMSLVDAMLHEDPGYWVFNHLSANAGLGVVGVNLVCGALMAVGIAVYARSLPRPWLAMLVAVPYLIIVVGMGYSRQAVALGFAMIGYVALGRKRFGWFVFWVLVGALFHRSAVILIPLAGFIQTRNRWLIALLALATAVIGYFVLLAESIDDLITHYVEASYQSQGALIRLAMNAMPAAIFLALRRRFRLASGERGVMTLLSVLSLGMFFAYFVTTASTALDRTALYFIPIQMAVLAHLPQAIGRRTAGLAVVSIATGYAGVLFVWLNFAANSRAWTPYFSVLQL
jgi:hypothetical protein